MKKSISRKIVLKEACVILIIAVLVLPSTVVIGENENNQIQLETYTGTLNNIKKPYRSVIPFWNPEHVVGIHIDKLYVYDSSDRGDGQEPGEYFFKIYAIPQLWHFTTDIYEVDDKTPDIPYHPDKLGAFKTKFTPQIIIILAFEEDKAHDLNSNDFLDWIVIRYKPPRGDYPLNNQYFEIFNWVNPYFKAVTKIYFYHL